MQPKMKTNASGFLKISTSRAIYPGSRKGCYVGLLLSSKLLRTVALFVAYDILQFTNVVQFLFIVKLFASLFLLVIQKPFSRGKRLSKHQWVRVIQHGFSNAVVSVLWLLGLTHAGPLRAILLFEHHHLIVAAAVGALLSGIGGASKMRGAVFIIVAVITLLLFDSDGSTPTSDLSAGVSQDSSEIVQYIISWTGVTDHKGGVLLLVIALCLHKGIEAMGRRLSVEIGGAKRLNAMATLASALTMAPWAFFTRFTQQDMPNTWMELVIPLASIALILFVIDYYVESVCFMKLEATSAIRNSWIPMFLFAAILTVYWKSSYVIPGAIYASHQLSGGVIFSCVAILLATYLLSSPSRQASKGTLVGYSESGEPLYSSHGDTMHSSSCLNTIRHSIKSIFEDSDSRRIFYFLCLNLTYTFVELIYGIWTNSLGLIADGFHMLFDCSALVMGLCAALMSKWKATPTFSFGYSRVDALSGFVNGLFLVVISIFVCSTAASRLWDPPQIISDKLLTVSVAGLCVNVVGILTFLRPKSSPQTRDAHSRHGHSHAPLSHSHGAGHHGHSHNANMEGVFLHVLADTLGSIGVIVSSVLIENFGWLVADPICSLFISILIFLSVLPLLWHSTQVLLLRVPVVIEKKLPAAVFKVVRLEGVVSYRNLHVWQHSSEIFAGTIHVHVTKESLEQRVVSQVTAIFRELGVNIFTVQVEKDDFFHHLSGLSSAVNSSRISEITNEMPFTISTVVKAV